MAYTTIDKGESHFNAVATTGTGSSQAVTGVGFKPDWIWGKRRDSSGHPTMFDSVRGVTKGLESSNNNAEFTSTDYYSSFDSDGFTIAAGSSGAGNASSATAVQWCWLAGGTAPAITYTVKVVDDGGNKYRFDDFGTSAVTLELQEGGTYTFDQSDSSNATHPLRFYTAADKTGGEYTTGVTTSGTPGSSGAKTVITVAASAPTLYYQCSAHAGMGGQANTNSLHGSSNFSGSIQSVVSANTTSGFSIVTYTGTGSNATVGHGLGAAPKWVITKARTPSGRSWGVFHSNISNANNLYLDGTDVESTGGTFWNSTSPTSTVFSVGTAGDSNGSSYTLVAYCFSEVKGFSKFGEYSGGNANANGPFVYLGFKPAFVIVRDSDNAENWLMYDNERPGFNLNNDHLFANTNDQETSSTANTMDLLSNGFKIRSTNNGLNRSGGTFLYMAFAEHPFVSSTGTPCTAR